ncbi:hypothetical protein [Streptomyces sp. Ncost-T10-10d]|uniref:hypothetical protein n=1 Tax=Streptomyces sp. Ncost-T10-10d TaxID=1839774 RepID=UPI00114CE75D
MSDASDMNTPQPVPVPQTARVPQTAQQGQPVPAAPQPGHQERPVEPAAPVPPVRIPPTAQALPVHTLQYRFDGPGDAPVLVIGPSLGTTWHRS